MANPQQQMKNPMDTSSMKGSTAHDDSSSIRDIGENLRQGEGHRVIDRAREFTGQVPQRAREVYDTSLSWVRGNYRNPYFIAAMAGVVGIVGFFVFRSLRDRSDYESYEI